MKKKVAKKKRMTQTDYDQAEYDESVRIGKIWKDKGLPKKAPENLEFREHQILSQRMFSEGHVIEAVIVLHGLIELELNKFWVIFVACTNAAQKEKKKMGDLKEKSYSDLTVLFDELGLLDKATIGHLKEFNDLRNKVSHNFYGIKKVKIAKTELKKKFENGLGVSGHLPIDNAKYLYEQKNTNSFAKKLWEEFQK